MGTAGADQLRIRPQVPQLRTHHQEPLSVTGKPEARGFNGTTPGLRPCRPLSALPGDVPAADCSVIPGSCVSERALLLGPTAPRAAAETVRCAAGGEDCDAVS